MVSCSNKPESDLLTENSKIMQVIPVPVLEDNYAYLLIDPETRTCAAVDPAQASKVIDAAHAEGLEISKVLTTHKHADHAGGNHDMARMIPGIEIVGGQIDAVQGCTQNVSDGGEISVGSISIRCIHTPGHTLGHICYYATQNDDHVVFTGDTLFIGGAGKFFEGTAQEMYPSLIEKLCVLPRQTKVFCGHEYTLSNYKFALSIDPHNEALIHQNDLALEARRSGIPTVPSTIETELATNPFLRLQDEAIKSAVGGDHPMEVLQNVREAKNRFR